jgi:predicted ATPase
MAALLGKAGNVDEGISLIDQTLQTSDTGGAHWWNAELHRIRANLGGLGSARQSDVQADLERAIAEARVQDARYFELRAVKDPARLWAAGGERQRAFDLLSPIHGWFTEGHETPELISAKQLLDESQ